MTLQYSIVGNEDGSANVTAIVPGKPIQVAHSSHPNFEAIREKLLAGDESVIELFDVAQSAASKFERLTERVTTAHGRLYFDGDEVNNALAEQVVRFLTEGVEDWKPLVKFFENLMQNPNEHSREQLYGWMTEQDITITEDGLMVGYKGVTQDKAGNFVSVRSGTANVDDVTVTGQIPNPIGAVVWMPRTEVMHNPQYDCDAGLHVGSFKYASSFGPNVLEVHVNPRDVVSVPDASWKLRTCRYTVVATIEVPYSDAVVWSHEDYDDYDYDDIHEDHAGDGDIDEDDELLRAAEELGIDLSHDSDYTPVDDLEEKPGDVFTSVQVGDVYETTDKRRAGTQFVVESIEGDEAIGKSLPRNLTRKVKTDRLLSYRYTKVN